MNVGEGRVALVTGASSGIGRATAKSFAREGYTTVLADIHEQAGLEAASECEAEGVASRFIACDVSDESSVQNLLAETVSKFGRIDAAFNNAGIEGSLAPTVDCTAADFDRVIATNLRGVWLCLREELRQMAKQDTGGAVVNCASVAGLVGFPGIPAYVASKHGVVGLTRAAALECAQQKIRVNAVCPGVIDTPMLGRLMDALPSGRQLLVEMEPVARLGAPTEIAEAVVWLCSPAASFVTGLAMAVDGGWTAR